ncbi:MAG: hypothetical protein JW745_07060 [Sedimentisphaerales bacterium]|nr:hypothetical protein [Sedimentisphaerales bacterium]MBN2843139.1 hypothetical protein [Sedimentisphaerales bacterium]
MTNYYIYILCVVLFIAGVGLGVILQYRTVKRLRQTRRQLTERLKQAQQMAHLGDLTSNLAHEIRNPLSIIKVNLQLLHEDIDYMLKEATIEDGFDFSLIDEPEKKLRRQLRKLTTLTGESDRLSETLNDFMRYAGKMELHPIEQDVNEVLDDLVDFYEPQAECHKVRIRRSLPIEKAVCRIDVDHFKQAILNLLINATQAMSETGGELIIRSQGSGGEQLIEIIDTGPGIPLENLEKIFDPYFTTRSGGTGLGLPTCRRIIEEMNGHITLHSEPGKGTAFTIALPLTPRRDA